MKGQTQKLRSAAMSCWLSGAKQKEGKQNEKKKKKQQLQISRH